jgi:regulator of protease activity HflC (stomatin/prohibitin superfamily)
VSLVEPDGYRKRPLRSGLGLVVPLLTQVYRYPIYFQTYTMSNAPHEGQRPGDDSIAARTSDGQAVLIDLSLIYAINPDEAPHVHIAWQDRYPESFIRPLLRGVVRSQVSQFTINEVNSSKRLNLELALSEELKMALEKQGFVLEHFLLRNIGFSTVYGLAVENKQVQEQGVVTSRYKADQVRLEAQGEADALQLLSAAIAQNPDVITLRYVDKLAPNIQIMLVPGNASYFLSLPTPNALATPGGSVTPTPTPTPTTP